MPPSSDPMAAHSSEEHAVLRRLQCSVQNYEWGRSGAESQVSRLYSLNSGAHIEAYRPYAELWMGTHESGPSFVLPLAENGGFSVGSEPLALKSWISQNPGVLGEKVLEEWGGDLPFLFKVLSVAKALSIQAHPDRDLARVLHKSLPQVYKDDNHKPEMALALTEFEVLCGFISAEELRAVLRDIPEILELASKVDADLVFPVNEQGGRKGKGKEFLQSIFSRLMLANKDDVAEAVSKLKRRLNMESKVRLLSDKEKLVLRLEKQYPGDVGVMSAFFLNHMKLNAGEALYIGANEPHAYISGDCIECMAASDNVVRAGLTPKQRDVATLCSMLTYKQGVPEIIWGVPFGVYTRKYRPPFREFEVDCCVLPTGASTHFTAVPGPSVWLVMEGVGVMCTVGSEVVISEGMVLFAPANLEICLRSSSELRLYRAGVNGRFFS